MPHDVFLSHSNQDRAAAESICGMLEASGVRVWVAPRDVPPGANFAGAIIDAIDACSVFILVCSAAANDSGHVLNEVNRAFDRGKTILPFRIQDVPPSNALSYYIGRMHWLDAITPPLERHIQKLVDSTLLYLGKGTAAPATIKPADQAQEPADQAQEPAALKPSALAAEPIIVKTAEPPAEHAPAQPDQRKEVEPPARHGGAASQTAEPPPPGGRLSGRRRTAWAGMAVLLLAAGIGFTLIESLLKPAPETARDTPAAIIQETMLGSPTAEVQGPTPDVTGSARTSSETGAADLQNIDHRSRSEKDGMTLVYVPAGEFRMGSDGTNDDERPAHTVYLDAFWIDQTEVTNARYRACAAAGACLPPAEKGSPTRGDYYQNGAYAGFPVMGVTWEQAYAYCAWAGRRLPSEAEWEKAARGTDGRRYPWGDGPPDDSLANFDDQAGDTTLAGSYPAGASPYGALDMAGNVWEWVSDWYGTDYYQYSPPENPAGPDTGEFRVIRGGSYNADNYSLRSVFRFGDHPGYWYSDVGLRCAMDESGSE